MKKILSLSLLLLMLVSSAFAGEGLVSYPAQSGLDAAMAINAMHTAVMRDVLESDYSFSELAGGDSIFVLFTDAEAENYLMISLTDEAEPRADMAVIQCYTLKEFDTHGLDSMKAIAMPFIPEDMLSSFDEWRTTVGGNAADAYREGRDLELTYYTGQYVTCAVSVMHDEDGKVLFTAIVSWNTPLAAEDITALMEADSDEY